MFSQVCKLVFPTHFMRNITVSFSNVPSCLPLKETLMKSLKDIKGYNNAYEFCGILMNAKRATETSEIFRNKFSFEFSRTTPWRKNESHGDVYIHQLKAIVRGDKPDYDLVNMFLKVLYDTTDLSDKTSEFVSLLLDIDKYHFSKLRDQNSRDDLENIMNYIESLINSYHEKSLYSQFCKEHPPGGINLLQFVLYLSTIDEANKLLNIIFEMGRAQLNFSTEEEENIGTLMIETIIPISKVIQCRSLCCKTKISSLLQKRSSLQFLKDVYSKFPARNGTLLENFYRDEINVNIQILDVLITDWYDFAETKYSDSRPENVSEVEHEWNDWETDDSDDDDETDLEEGGGSEMPKSHAWWSKCSQLFSKQKNIFNLLSSNDSNCTEVQKINFLE